MATIIVGLDESEHSAEALRWAVAEGDRHGWDVRAVLAWTFLRQHRVDRTSVHDPEYDEESAGLALASYVADAVGDEAAARIALQLVCELPGPALVEAAQGADLVVVGSHGYGGVAGLVMGSVSQHCLHHVQSPIAILRGPDRRTDLKPGKVVVGVDGSDTSRRALAWALDEARSRQGYVEVVHSWMLPSSYGFPTLAVPDLAVFEEGAEAMVAQLVDSADTSGLSRPINRVIVGGTSTAGLLADRAADAELLVVGSRGIGGFAGMLVGSVAHQLSNHAPGPLVVIPAAVR